MKAMLLILVASLLAGGAMVSAAEEPEWYYQSPCQQPEGVSLEDWLPSLEWVPYERGVYDCTEMSARIEWMAENCGYSAVIGCDDGHCWVLIEGAAFEPTGNYWVPEDHTGKNDYYHPDEVYETVVGPEWDWYKVHPELRSE